MSLDLDKLSALFDLLAAKDIAEFEHEENGVRLRVARGLAIAHSGRAGRRRRRRREGRLRRRQAPAAPRPSRPGTTST